MLKSSQTNNIIAFLMNYHANFDLKNNNIESLFNKQFFTVIYVFVYISHRILIISKCRLLGLSKQVRFFAEREIRKIHISCPHRQGMDVHLNHQYQIQWSHGLQMHDTEIFYSPNPNPKMLNILVGAVEASLCNFLKTG